MLDFAINHKEKLIETHKRFLTQNVAKYNGRIIGVSKSDIELLDGKIYDTVRYEIFNPEFLKL